MYIALIITSILSMASAVPHELANPENASRQLLTRQYNPCPRGDYPTAQCCSVTGITSMDCNGRKPNDAVDYAITLANTPLASPNPTSASHFKSICNAITKYPQCCKENNECMDP